jgi:hypothetical protein
MATGSRADTAYTACGPGKESSAPCPRYSYSVVEPILIKRGADGRNFKAAAQLQVDHLPLGPIASKAIPKKERDDLIHAPSALPSITWVAL